MSNQEIFRAIAEANLDRRIRKMHVLDENNRIDTSLISHAEYQLFLEDMYGKNKYHQPDHWEGRKFPAGHAQTPVVGVRPSDAIAFCEWLTEQGLGVFRLPNQWETTQIEDQVLGFWQVKSGGGVEYKGKRLFLDEETNKNIQPKIKQYKREFLDLENLFNPDRRRIIYDIDVLNKMFYSFADTPNWTLWAGLNLDMVYDELDEAESELGGILSPFDFDRALVLNRSSASIAVEGLVTLFLRRQGLIPAFEGIFIIQDESL